MRLCLFLFYLSPAVHAFMVPSATTLPRLSSSRASSASSPPLVRLAMSKQGDPGFKEAASSLVLAVSAACLVAGWGRAALADGRSGQEVFSLKCAACHAGGGNTMAGGKTLSMADLEKNGYASVESIVEIVSKGKPPIAAHVIQVLHYF